MLSDTSSATRLVQALVEIEKFVGHSGWDQPVRLFALVDTEELLSAEPSLADQVSSGEPGHLSSVEQDDFNPTGADLMTALSQIGWPEKVLGCAIATERSFLAPEFEDDIPADPTDAAAFVTNHPNRQDLRVVAGALRVPGGTIEHCVARLSSEPDELLASDDMVPALTNALSFTLQPQ